MAQVSWMWGGKRYYGTLIRETKTHKFARTKNGKIKKIKKCPRCGGDLLPSDDMKCTNKDCKNYGKK